MGIANKWPVYLNASCVCVKNTNSYFILLQKREKQNTTLKREYYFVFRFVRIRYKQARCF